VGKKVGVFLRTEERNGLMRNTNIARLDSKGRLLIPSHIRKFLNVDEGTDVVILPDSEKSEARILPLLRDKTAEFRITMTDSPGSLALIAGILARYNINVLMSKSRSIVKGKVAEWDLIVDTSACNGKIERMRNNMLGSNLIKNMEILRV
jgi:bifunctional DNA-binding transcriptional regulator/antitoxin component of YhaV-PrlF toxin-antitoxin module